MLHRMRAALGLVTVAFIATGSSAGCAKKEWKCTACVRGSSQSCANSSRYVQNKTEADARCSAGEELCSALDRPTFERICQGQSATRMLGCSDAFLGQLTFTCTSEVEANVPLPGVR